MWPLVVLFGLPWLWPWATGPWPGALPWMASLGCGCLIVLLATWRAPVLAEVAGRAWFLVAALSGAIGLVQYLGASTAFQPLINVTAAGEAFGNLRQRNQFATLTSIGLSAALLGPWARTWIADQWRDASTGQGIVARWWVGSAVALMAIGNAASGSRTGLIELLLLACLALFWNGWRDRPTRHLLGVMALSYAVAAVLLPLLVGLDPVANGIGARFLDVGMPCGTRRTMWTNVLTLIGQRPLTGWGWGELDYAHFMAQYPGTRFCEILDNAHNLPLHLAVELGAPVAVLACGLAALLVWRARPWQEGLPARQLAWAVLAVVMFHSMLEYPLWYGPFQVAACACLWILWSSDRGTVTPAWLRRGVMVLSLASLVALAGAFWDYHRVGQLYLSTSQRDPAYRVNTLEKVRDSWLFAHQVNFAELTTTDVTEGNAQRIHAMALELLHFSPEPRVVERLIESAALLGRDDEVRLYQARFEVAFPQAYARWLKSRSQP